MPSRARMTLTPTLGRIDVTNLAIGPSPVTAIDVSHLWRLGQPLAQIRRVLQHLARDSDFPLQDLPQKRIHPGNNAIAHGIYSTPRLTICCDAGTGSRAARWQTRSFLSRRISAMVRSNSSAVTLRGAASGP